MSEVNPKIEESWKIILDNEFKTDSFKSLKQFLVEEKNKYVIYPPGPKIFSAFEYTPFDKVRVVILGQDPYHGPGQAHGLSFSVPDGIKPPPSLINIFKELQTDLNIPISKTGNLEKWAKQGVLLLNATLTVRANSPASHQKHGWEEYTDAVIKKLSDQKKGIVFILWGRYAQAKEVLIDQSKHYILKSPHPSPFSAYNGFFGCKHFSKINKLLTQQGLAEIDWKLE